MRSWVISLLIAVVIGTASTVLAEYPMPTGPGEPLNTYNGLYLYPYDAPFVDHVGRFIDSAFTGDILSPPPRTLRAKEVSVVSQNNRVYMQMGEHFIGYDLGSFFSSLGSPLSFELTELHGDLAERYLPWNGSVYPESPGSGWSTYLLDGQQRLFDYAWDDRGYLYPAYYIWGFGIVQDSNFRTVRQVNWNETSANPQEIAAFKADDRYYVIVGGAKTEIWDVTQPTSPIRVRVPGFGLSNTAVAHVGTGDVVGLVVSRYDSLLGATVTSFEVYRASDLVLGGAPIHSIRAGTGQKILDVATDETNFYVVEKPITGRSFTLHTLILSDESVPTYTRTQYSISGIAPDGIRYGSDHLTVWGSDADRAYDVWLYRLESQVPVRRPLGDFIKNYYTILVPPAGYTNPALQGYTSSIYNALYTEYQGKGYLIVSTKGLGDVYELELDGAPDPVVEQSGCMEVGEPCELTMSSANGNSIADWSISWYLDGSLSATGPVFQPSFSTTGTYVIRAIASNDHGSAEYVNSLNVTECVGAPIVVGIGYVGATSGCTPNSSTGCLVNEIISFTPETSLYDWQDCDEFLWEFGDGTTSPERTPAHQYTLEGDMSVKLTVTNKNGTAFAETLVFAGTPVVAPASVNYSYAPGFPEPGEMITFTASTSGGTPATSWEWSFGDGGTGSGEVVSHMFVEEGKFKVGVTAANSAGSAFIEKDVEVTVRIDVNGDANGDSKVTVADIFYLVNYIFADGPAPIGSGDANSDGSVNTADIFYLINYLFAGGPPP